MATKMIDLGHLESECETVPAKTSKKRKKYYPTVWLDAGVPLPLKPTDVGKNFNITGRIHITGIEESTTEERKNKKEFRFELRAMQIDNSRDRLKEAVKKNAR